MSWMMNVRKKFIIVIIIGGGRGKQSARARESQQMCRGCLLLDRVEYFYPLQSTELVVMQSHLAAVHHRYFFRNHPLLENCEIMITNAESPDNVTFGYSDTFNISHDSIKISEKHRAN